MRRYMYNGYATSIAENHFQDLFINCYTDNLSFDTLLLDDSSNSQESFVERRRVLNDDL